MTRTRRYYCRIRFGFRSLLLVTTCVGVLVALLDSGPRNERRVRDLCNSLNGKIGYDYQWQPSSSAWLHYGHIDYGRPAPTRSWITNYLGTEYATDIVSIDLSRTAISDDDLVLLGRIKTLKEVNVAQTRISDIGMHRLRGCREIERLNVEETGLTVAGLTHLTSFPKLGLLSLSGKLITRDGMDTLKQLKSLRWILVHASGQPDGYAFTELLARERDKPGFWHVVD